MDITFLSFILYIITGWYITYYILPRLNFIIGFHEFTTLWMVWPVPLIRGIIIKIRHRHEDYALWHDID
jgi:hypothetical protein